METRRVSEEEAQKYINSRFFLAHASGFHQISKP